MANQKGICCNEQKWPEIKSRYNKIMNSGLLIVNEIVLSDMHIQNTQNSAG